MAGEEREYYEEKCIKAAANGCHDSFAQIVYHHQDYIYQVCYRLLQDAHEARDASQDVFLKAYQALPRFKPKAKLSTWLYQIAMNTCRDRWNRNSTKMAKQSHSLESSEEALERKGSSPNVDAEWSDEVKKFESALKALPAKHREIIVLSCIEELSHAECGEILGCSTRAVEGRLRRAREVLRPLWDGLDAPAGSG
jgi:RNA polymerase sigma-70 factor (ECF subfamily)